jgi:hypothetical protein
MARQKISGFHLNNNGGFVCAGKIQYVDNGGGTGVSDRYPLITLGQGEGMDPKNVGVQDGYLIDMYIYIEAGNDRTGGNYFEYDSTANLIATYSISGTTLNSTVTFEGIGPPG